MRTLPIAARTSKVCTCRPNNRTLQLRACVRTLASAGVGRGVCADCPCAVLLPGAAAAGRTDRRARSRARAEHCLSVSARSPRIRTPPVAQRRALLPAIPRRKPFAGGNFAGWGAGRGGGGWCRQSVGRYFWVLRCVGRSQCPPWQHDLPEIAFFRAPHDRFSGLHSHSS